ncbi:MAG: pyridoxal phosphate-dependent aminotransferase [Clostridiales bacterium]|nr:pyridoxal phosphate-dependent aminotransferase [Clostridiales bacterium]
MSLELSKKAQNVKPSSTLAITAKAKELKGMGIDVVGFGAGEPDFNTPDNINDAAIEAIKSGFTKYTPASGTLDLKKAVCKKFKEFNNVNYNENQIVISNGGKHSLTNIFQAIINPGDEVIIPTPYWLSYPEIVKLAGGTPIFVETTKENDFKITPDQLAAACNDNTKAFILNSPSNPTGVVYDREELEAIAKVIVEKDIYVVSDEMYEYLTYDGAEHVSIASLNDEIYKRTITCSGVSKSYAMTGWRIGYTGSSVEIAKYMSSIQSHQTSNPNSIAQVAATEAINGPQDAIVTMREEFDKRRKYILDRVNNIPYLEVTKPQGAFYIFVDCSKALERSYKGEKIETTSKLAEILINDYNVAVVPCQDFGSPNYIRLSYATSIQDIEKGMDRIQKFIETL